LVGVAGFGDDWRVSVHADLEGFVAEDDVLFGLDLAALVRGEGGFGDSSFVSS
jgi:hypothetical protein